MPMPDQTPTMMPPGPGGPMGAPPAPPGAGPSPDPTALPTQPRGLQEAARVNVHIAVTMLEQALPALGSSSEDGQIIIRALSALTKHFGASQSKELAPAELMQLMNQAPQVAGSPLPGPVGQPVNMPGGAPALGG